MDNPFFDVMDDIHMRMASEAVTAGATIRYYKFLANPQEIKVPAYPAMITYWDTSEVNKNSAKQQQVETEWTHYFVTIIRIRESTPELSFRKALDLYEFIKNTLIGYQPVINSANLRISHPILPVHAELYEADGADIGVYLIWQLNTTEMIEVNSALY